MSAEKFQLVYVLTSDSSDIYYEQTLISAWSARYFNPSLRIVVIVDENTKNTLSGCRNGLNQIVDEIKVIDVPEEFCKNKTIMSRWLRTNVRHFLEGTILVVDTDTVIVDKLDDVAELKSDISAVYDGHKKNSTVKSGPVCKQREILGLPIKCSGYYNGGVLFVKDSEKTRSFYHKWFDYWNKCMLSGVCFDQSPLFKANQDMRIIAPLLGIWNCQCPMIDSYPFLKKSKILHVFNFTERVYAYDLILQKVKILGNLSEDVQKDIIGLKDKLIKNVDFLPYLCAQLWK